MDVAIREAASGHIRRAITAIEAMKPNRSQRSGAAIMKGLAGDLALCRSSVGRRPNLNGQSEHDVETHRLTSYAEPLQHHRQCLRTAFNGVVAGSFASSALEDNRLIEFDSECFVVHAHRVALLWFWPRTQADGACC
jgi:hypothetical protein